VRVGVDVDALVLGLVVVCGGAGNGWYGLAHRQPEEPDHSVIYLLTLGGVNLRSLHDLAGVWAKIRSSCAMSSVRSEAKQAPRSEPESSFPRSRPRFHAPRLQLFVIHPRFLRA